MDGLHYQYELAIIGQLTGPGSLGSLPFLQSLFTADLAVCFPLRKTLKGGKETNRAYQRQLSKWKGLPVFTNKQVATDEQVFT